MADPETESMLAALTAEVRRRFGADRAAGLASELDALARDLARVTQAPVPPDLEPGMLLDDAADDPPGEASPS